MFSLIWLGSAAATALAIALDMHQLRARRVGLTLISWLIAAACAGPLAGLSYLYRRGAVKRTLIDAAWTFAGNATVPTHVRRERLDVLKNAGLLGRSIYNACSSVLDAEEEVKTEPIVRVVDTSHSHESDPDRSS